MNTKKLTAVIVVLAVIVVVLSYLLPVTPQQNLEAEGNYKHVVECYKSEEYDVVGDKCIFYTSVCDDLGNSNQIYIVNCFKRGGILSNRFSTEHFSVYSENDLNKKNVYNEVNMFKLSNGEAKVAYGILPFDVSDCFAGGKKAATVKQSITLNSKEYAFTLWYCSVSDENDFDVYYLNSSNEKVVIK